MSNESALPAPAANDAPKARSWGASRRPARRWALRLALLVGAPLTFLLAIEIGLRVAGFGYATSYFLPSEDGHRLVENPDFGRRFFPRGLLRLPPATSFLREKPEGTVRIFLFGESAAMGDPQPAYGVARYLGALMHERYPGQSFEVIAVAMTAINSHALLPMARECAALKGDYWVVLAGNNELLGPFGAGTALGGPKLSWPWVRLSLAAKATRLGQAIEALAARLRPRNVPTGGWQGPRLLAGEHVPPNAASRRRVYAAFERNLRDLVRTGQAAGAQVLLSTVPVNLRDCAPFGSAHRTDWRPQEEAEWEQWRASGERALTNATPDPAEALEALNRASALDPDHATIEFLRAEALLALTNRDLAVEAFARARDLDTIPLRTDSALNRIVEGVALDTEAGLVDGSAALAARAPSGVPGAESFYEHVHLTPEGNHALARAFAEAVGARLPEAVRARATADWASPEECATRLALTAWNRAAATEGMMRRCLVAPFTNRWNQATAIDNLARDVLKQRRSQTPEAARFVRAIYTNAIANAPNDPHLRRVYAEFLEATRDQGEAAAQWRRVVELWPHHPYAYLQAGSLLRRSNQLEDARPLIEKAVALQPDWVEARLELADLFLARGRPGDAVRAAREAIALQPAYGRAHLRLADALAADQQRELAVASLEEAVRLDPNLFEARYFLGVEYALEDRIEAAREQFAEVVRLKPDHALAQFNLGIALARQQRWETAAAALAEALRLDPRNEQARSALAQITTMRMSEESGVRSQKSEVRSQEAEVRRQEPEENLQ